MTSNQIFNTSDMTGVTGGSGTAYPSGAHHIFLVRFVLLNL